MAANRNLETSQSQAPRGRAEVDQAVRQARRLAAGWVRSMPLWMDRDAFVGEAVLAVAVACDRYRADAGLSFPSFVQQRVRYALVGEARRQDPVSQWRRAQLKSGTAEERPSDQHPLSLDALIGSDEGWLDPADPGPGPESAVLQRETRTLVHAALAKLTARQRLVLHCRYWEGLSQPAVARRLQISAARVHQIERDALLRVRRLLDADLCA